MMGIYRASLWLFPPAFRREFGSEIVRDFDELRQDFRRRGVSAWHLHTFIAADLLHSLMTQWLQHGRPAIALAALSGPFVLFSAIGAVWNRIVVHWPDNAEV